MEPLTGLQLQDLLTQTAQRIKGGAERYGQALWNIAEERYPDLVKPLRETEVDCFHIQKNINPFLKKISQPDLHENIDLDFY